MIIQWNLPHTSLTIILLWGKIQCIKGKQICAIGWLEQGFSVYPQCLLLFQKLPWTICGCAGLYTHWQNPHRVTMPRALHYLNWWRSFQQCRTLQSTALKVQILYVAEMGVGSTHRPQLHLLHFTPTNFLSLMKLMSSL